MLKKLSAIAATAVLALATGGATFAGTSVGLFEIDGNRADNSGPGDLILDWDSPPPNLTTFTDASGSSDDAFGLGSKELAPGGWQCINGSAPSNWSARCTTCCVPLRTSWRGRPWRRCGSLCPGRRRACSSAAAAFAMASFGACSINT